MDRRSWPWRKKSSEKILGLNEFLESSQLHMTRHLDEQTVPRDHTGFHFDEGASQWQQSIEQQSEEKVEQMKERLSVALLDASAKDVLIKQHAKVAEEAVSGWERAEVEAKNLKHDLESVMQQKLAAEDRVSHLEGALNECMQQLRHVREEQEAKIHDTTMKNLKGWEKMRAELEERLTDMEQRYLDADAENKTISTLLQERALTISELSGALSRAEVNLNVLQLRLEAMERERSALKFECSNLKKELDIRNEEKVFSRRSTEAASKQQLEDARKMAKLEGDSHRYRGLGRKKLPGLGASMQIKLEADSSRSKHDSSKKKVGKGALREREDVIGLNNKLQEETPNGGGKDVDAVLNRLSAMEDETRRLKELLARRDNELQQSRLMCARTASKLSSVEEQLECLLHDKGLQKNAGISALDKHVEAARSLTVSCEPSLASASEDGNDDCSDAWASALISELAQFKMEKVTSSQEGLDMPKTLPETNFKVDPAVSLATDDTNILEQKLAQKDVELHAAHQLCEQVGDKLRSAEKELATLQLQDAATQSSLWSVQCQLDAILQAQVNGGDMDIVLDQVREANGLPYQRKGQKERTIVGSKQLMVEPNLTSAVSTLVRIVENLGITLWVPGFFCKSNEIEAKIRAFSAGTELFHEGSASILEFLEDLASILGDLVKMKVVERELPPYPTINPCSGNRIPSSVKENEVFSSISGTAESHVREEQANKALRGSRNTDLLEQEVTRLEGELRKVQGEKIALETHMRMEFKRFEGLHDEVAQLQGDKTELERLVEVVKEELDHLRIKLHQAEHTKSSFQDKLSSAESSVQLMQQQLQSLNSSKAEVVSQLEATKAEHICLKDRKEILERECLEKNEKIAGLESKCQELSKQLSEYICSRCNSANGQQMASKEQEIAVKLAECQQTILFLGKQMKAFTPSRELLDGSSNPSSDIVQGYELPQQYKFSHSTSELHAAGIRGFVEVNTGTSAYRRTKMRAHAQKEMEWEPQRDSNASDALDSELMSLSKSGKPLLELFGDKTPAHEHYIRAVEQLTSSSDDEFVLPGKVEPPMNTKSAMKPPLSRKKKSPRSYRGVDMSKSMDDTSSEKLNTFTRLFSRAKNS